MNIESCFSVVQSSKSIAALLGIIEDSGYKLTALMNSEFESGVRALQQASFSTNERKSLLREARARFNKAISLEKYDRLTLTYLGLAFCHYHLGDSRNSTNTLKELAGLEFKASSGEKINRVTRFIPKLGMTSMLYYEILKRRRILAQNMVSDVKKYLNKR